jgi:hypothetical protein
MFSEFADSFSEFAETFVMRQAGFSEFAEFRSVRVCATEL